MPVLDTNLLVRIRGGDPVAIRALTQLQGRQLIVPAQVVTEYLVRAVDHEKEIQALEESFSIAHTTHAHASDTARLAAKSFGNLTPRPRWADLHIAATAVANRTFVVSTNKKDFARLGVPCWDYAHEPLAPEG